MGKRFSPYNYAENNPIRNIDPDGMWTETANGWSSDNAAEAKVFFKQLQQQNGGDKDKKKKKMNLKRIINHPERIIMVNA